MSLYHLLQDDGVTGTWRRNPSQGQPSAVQRRDVDEADPMTAAIGNPNTVMTVSRQK
jgi:hypothetical protein